MALPCRFAEDAVESNISITRGRDCGWCALRRFPRVDDHFPTRLVPMVEAPLAIYSARIFSLPRARCRELQIPRLRLLISFTALMHDASPIYAEMLRFWRWPASRFCLSLFIFRLRACRRCFYLLRAYFRRRSGDWLRRRRCCRHECADAEERRHGYCTPLAADYI